MRDLAARIGLDLGPDEGPPPVFVDLRATERVWNELLAPRLRPRFALDAVSPALAVSDTTSALAVGGPVVCADVRIPVAFVERAVKSTALLARKAARMDLPVPELTFSDERIELVEFDTGISGYVKTTRALLTLPAPPTVDRWRFVARIDNPGGILAENLLVRVPGTSDPIPERYRTANYRACDHCGKQRDRRETFLVTDGAEWHQVGRDCLGDFMHRDPGTVLVYLEALGRIIPQDEDVRSGMSDGFRTGRIPALYPMRDIIELTATIASLDGWVSRDTARRAYEEENRHLITTAFSVERLLSLNATASREDRLWAARYVASEKSAALRDATFAALDEISTRSSLVEWERSLLTLWGAGFTDRIHLPLAASAVVLGRRRLAEAEKVADQKAAAVAPNPPHFLGTIGERLRNLTVEVTYERESESDFGPRRYVLSRAVDGALIEWWMNTYPEVTKGDRLSLTGTVKNHRWLDRSGEQVTTLNRVAIADPPPPDASEASVPA